MRLLSVQRLGQRVLAGRLAPVRCLVSTGRARIWRVTAAAGVVSSVAGAVVAARYFKYELEDLRRLLGLGTDDLTAAERRELAELEFVSEAVLQKIPGHGFVHPFHSKSLLWRLGFVIYRSLFLLVTFLPVAWLSLRLHFDKENKSLREHWMLTLRRALERCGTTLIKFGQWMSMRPDHFPPDLCVCLAHLRDAVPAHEFDHTRATFREAFGCEIEAIFDRFDTEPVASGSVAQVYHAKLRDEYALATGATDVAVKVRHPHVSAETFLDLKFIFRFIPTLMVVLDLDVKLPFDQVCTRLILD